MNWFLNNGGQGLHEGDYPYKNRDPLKNCDKAKNIKMWHSGSKVVEHLYFSDPSTIEEKMMQMIYELGAVYVNMHASDKGFWNYASGVFEGCRWHSLACSSAIKCIPKIWSLTECILEYLIFGEMPIRYTFWTHNKLQMDRQNSHVHFFSTGTCKVFCTFF